MLILSLCFRCQLIMKNEASPHSREWLFIRAKCYQEYMKLIPVPINRGSVIPYTSWVGLGSSIKEIYKLPLLYLTNVQLKRMDRERLGSEDKNVQLDMIIHQAKDEDIIWHIKDVYQRTSSPNHLLQLWKVDSNYDPIINPNYDPIIDPIYPKLEHKQVKLSSKQRSMASKKQVDFLSGDSSSSDNDVSMADQLNDEPQIILSDEAWLFRRAKSYQEYMKLIRIPTCLMLN